MYSQSKEEYHIVMYFRNHVGRLLDIGAYDGKTFSNSLALLLRGWHGTMIEPSPEVFEKLKKNLNGLHVACGNFTIGTTNGTIKFYNNDNAVATTSKVDKDKWVKEKFIEIEVPVRRFDAVFKGQKFDFINIDTEGTDWGILQQIDIDKVGCKCVCIEWNLDRKLYRLYANYFRRFKMKKIYESAENVIYVK